MGFVCYGCLVAMSHNYGAFEMTSLQSVGSLNFQGPPMQHLSALFMLVAAVRNTFLFP